MNTKLLTVSGVCWWSLLRVYASVSCSISIFFVYMYVRMPSSPGSIAGVPLSQALPGFLITVYPSVCVPDVIAIGGANFEIIPTNNILHTHHLWAGSLHFSHELVTSCMIGKSARKSQRRRSQSRDRLRTSEIPIPLLVSSAVTHHCHSSACIAFPRLAPFHRTSTDLDRGNYLNFCTSWFRCFVPDLEVWYLNLKVSPTE